MAAASTSMAITSALFNPLDVVKCRLQAQGALTNDENKRLYKGTRHCFRMIYTQEGLMGLWRPGLAASIMRDVINGAIRMGMYPTVKDGLPWEDTGVVVKLCAGLVTGAAGAFLGNPMDVIKIRFQTEAGCLADGRYVTGLYKGNAPSSAHTLDALVGLCKNGELLRGTGPSVARASLVTAGQVTSYDHTKQVCRDTVGEGPALFVFAGAISGLVATTISAPVDLVKTRVMSDRKDMVMENQEREIFRHGVDCFKRTFSSEGIQGLYKGWLAAYMRLGPLCIISWPMLEFVRTRIFGLGYF